jgi:hypothetical protein
MSDKQNMCIISNVPRIKRPIKMTVRLSPDEEAMRDMLVIHDGTSPSDVMRTGMLEKFRRSGLVLEPKKEPAPEGTGKRKRS